MSVRDTAIAVLANALDGPLNPFNALERYRARTFELGEREMTRDEFYDRYGSAYVRLIDSIDWNRVMIEANARHLTLEHGESRSDEYGVIPEGRKTPREVCPECICEALLTTDPLGRLHRTWRDQPRAPRDPRG